MIAYNALPVCGMQTGASMIQLYVGFLGPLNFYKHVKSANQNLNSAIKNGCISYFQQSSRELDGKCKPRISKSGRMGPNKP